MQSVPLAAVHSHINKYPIIFLKNVLFRDLKVLVDYMCLVKVNVPLNEFLFFKRVADHLKVSDLSDIDVLKRILHWREMLCYFHLIFI